MAGIVAKSELRTQFFDLLFEDNEGWLCICSSDPRAPKSRFRQEFFEWPKDSLRMENYILKLELALNVYFCPQLLSKPERIKNNCLPTDILWADLDTANPDERQPEPQIVIESSPNRFQALWKLSTKIDPIMAEDYAKRIAYAWGADKSGWDLTQLLRVPFTKNQKYDSKPEIMLVRSLEHEAAPLLFEGLPKVETNSSIIDSFFEEMPTADALPNADQIIYKFAHQLRGTSFSAIYTQEPDTDDDWSKTLWRLIHICFEAGMNAVEVFAIVKDAPCNKYKRDDRPDNHLWREILKASTGAARLAVITGNFRPLIMPDLVDPDSEPPITDSFVDRYSTWAVEATDAVPQFHELSAFIALSSIVANSIRLNTSYGPMVPNLWGLILGDSTLTRKTTAMRMVTDMILTIDPEIILATDGTAEGLLTGLSERNNKTSVFYKDEVSGFFDSINRREYLAGMPETLTHLYDVPAVYTRRLRRETIHIESPIFIFFGGGVRDRVYEALTEQYVLSGFLPRFLIVSGDADLTKLRRTGPATELGTEKRSGLIAELANLYEMYATNVITKIGGQPVSMPARITAHMTDKAWSTYGDIETLLVKSASESSIPDLALPTFERMSRSLLKMATIISAERQVPKDETIIVEEQDIITAAYYIQRWGVYSIEAITNAGRKLSEKILDKIVDMIQGHPGVLRSTIMQQRHLTKREADEILGTLEDRQLIRSEKQGRGARYYVA